MSTMYGVSDYAFILIYEGEIVNVDMLFEQALSNFMLNL